jgi:hypothetical protein
VAVVHRLGVGQRLLQELEERIGAPVTTPPPESVVSMTTSSANTRRMPVQSLVSMVRK